MKKLKKAVGQERLAELKEQLSKIGAITLRKEFVHAVWPDRRNGSRLLKIDVMRELLSILDKKPSGKHGYSKIHVDEINVDHHLPWSASTQFEDENLDDFSTAGKTNTRLVGRFEVDGVSVVVGTRFISHPFWQYFKK